MKTIYSLLILFLLCFISQAHAQQQWLNLYNGESGGSDGSNAVIVDAANNTYVTGFTTGVGTMKDITTLKYNSRGSLVWSMTYNGSGNSEDEAYAITVDATGNIYIAGYTTNTSTGRDMIIIKYNNSGQQNWVQTYNGSGNGQDEAYAITVDNFGDPIIAGYSFHTDMGLQMTVIKYNSSGNLQWVHLFDAYAGGGEDVAYAITVDAANNIYIAGYSDSPLGDSPSNKDMVTVKINAAGIRQWVNTYDAASLSDEAYAITVDAYDNIFITGYTTNENGKDYTTIKYDKFGTQKWLNTYNNPSANSDDIPAKLIIDSDGNVIVTGSSRSSSSSDNNDYVTIKYKNNNGSEEFVARYNDASDNSDNAYALTSNNGRIYVAGSSQSSSSPGSEDIVIVEYNKIGMMLAKYRVINPGTDLPSDISVDKRNNITIAGSLNGELSDDMGAGRFNGEEFEGYSSGFAFLNVTHTYDMSTLANVNTGIPNSFGLYQNYPNPFNPSTTIKFDVSSASMVKVAIFDALGREISVPVNDYLSGGTYEISINLSALTTGVYFYKMTSGAFSDIKKMMLIK